MSMDSYEALESIGSGSFGIVRKIRRKSDDKILVWKELNYGKMSEKEKQLVVSEVNILRELRNPFIVRYYDRIVEKSTTTLYIVMECCSGGDLGRVIKQCRRDRKNIDESLIWKILSQAVLGLKDCHRRIENGECRPILHRDLKPANILLDSERNIKIGDFGLAKELTSQSKLAQTNVGTPFYMSPELIAEKKYDERSDIWALGCLIYELAALRPPFDATNAVVLGKKIEAGRFDRIPRKYSDDLFNVIRSMLQVDRRKRPKIEDLESLPALRRYISDASQLLNKYRNEQKMTNIQREMAVKEEELVKREKAVACREAECTKKEDEQKRKTKSLEMREAALAKQLQQFHTQREKDNKLKKDQMRNDQNNQNPGSSSSDENINTNHATGITTSGFAIHMDTDNDSGDRMEVEASQKQHQHQHQSVEVVTKVDGPMTRRRSSLGLNGRPTTTTTTTSSSNDENRYNKENRNPHPHQTGPIVAKLGRNNTTYKGTTRGNNGAAVDEQQPRGLGVKRTRRESINTMNSNYSNHPQHMKETVFNAGAVVKSTYANHNGHPNHAHNDIYSRRTSVTNNNNTTNYTTGARPASLKIELNALLKK